MLGAELAAVAEGFSSPGRQWLACILYTAYVYVWIYIIYVYVHGFQQMQMQSLWPVVYVYGAGLTCIRTCSV
jgi:hypothetical protein